MSPLKNNLDRLQRGLRAQTNEFRREDGWVSPDSVAKLNQLLRDGLNLKSLEELHTWQDQAKKLMDTQQEIASAKPNPCKKCKTTKAIIIHPPTPENESWDVFCQDCGQIMRIPDVTIDGIIASWNRENPIKPKKA